MFDTSDNQARSVVFLAWVITIFSTSFGRGSPGLNAVSYIAKASFHTTLAQPKALASSWIC